MKKVSALFLALLLCFNISLSSAQTLHASVIEANLSSSRTVRSRPSQRVKSSSRQPFRSKRKTTTTQAPKTKQTTTTYRPSFGYYIGRTIHSIFSWYFWGPIIRVAAIIVVVIVLLYFLRRLFIH